MFNKMLTISTTVLYAMLLLLVAMEQVSRLDLKTSKFLRINLAINSKPLKSKKKVIKVLPPPKITAKKLAPNTFELSNYGLQLNQNNWLDIKLLANAGGNEQLKLKEVIKKDNHIKLLFTQGFKLTLKQGEQGLSALLERPTTTRRNVLLLPLVMAKNFSSNLRNNSVLISDGKQSYTLHSSLPLQLTAAGQLGISLPKASQTELFTINQQANSYPNAAYTTYLASQQNLLQQQLENNGNATPKEQELFYAFSLRNGEAKPEIRWKINNGRPSYLLAPYLGVSISKLRSQINIDAQTSRAMIRKTPAQLLSWDRGPAPAPFLFNHYQLNKLRELLSYSYKNITRVPLNQQIERMLILSQILLIKPEMVRALGAETVLANIINRSIIPAVSKRLEESQEIAPLQLFKTISLLKNWANYSKSTPSLLLSKRLILQLQLYQEENGSIPLANGKSMALSEIINWISDNDYRSIERSVTPGFWVQGISRIESDYRPGLYINIKTQFPAGQTQYLILRGIYFSPKQVLFNNEVQPYNPSWPKNPKSSKASGWYYSHELKTLIIKATYSLPKYTIRIPY